jgi:hypothetical protein
MNVVVAGKKVLELEDFAKFQEALAAALPRDLDPDLALDLLQNKGALGILLQEALTREKLMHILGMAGKRPGIRRRELVIDGDAAPRLPDDMTLDGFGAEHRKMGAKIKLEMRADGKLYANGAPIERVLLPHQEDLRGHRLRKELAKDRCILNACFLDALTTHQEFIPEEWKAGYTYFWGTIFRGPHGQLYVGCLFWMNGKWRWTYEYIGHRWSARGHAACIGGAVRTAA